MPQNESKQRKYKNDVTDEINLTFKKSDKIEISQNNNEKRNFQNHTDIDANEILKKFKTTNENNQKKQKIAASKSTESQMITQGGADLSEKLVQAQSEKYNIQGIFSLVPEKYIDSKIRGGVVRANADDIKLPDLALEREAVEGTGQCADLYPMPKKGGKFNFDINTKTWRIAAEASEKIYITPPVKKHDENNLMANDSVDALVPQLPNKPGLIFKSIKINDKDDRTVHNSLDALIRPEPYYPAMYFKSGCDTVKYWNSEPDVQSLVTVTGHKRQLVNEVNKLIGAKADELDKNTDFYIEPYGGALTYLNNLEILKNTIKPIHIYVSDVYEPDLAAFYNELKTAKDKSNLDAKKQLLMDIIDKAKDIHDEAATNSKLSAGLSKKDIVAAVNALEAPKYYVKVIINGSDAISYKNIKARVEKYFDAFANSLRRNNVFIYNNSDGKAFEDINKLARDRSRVTLIDDSDYPNLAGEKLKKSVYNNILNKEGDSLSPAMMAEKKLPLYKNLLANKGHIIATNNLTPALLGPLMAFDPDVKVYSLSSRPKKDLETQQLNKIRPEYIALFGDAFKNQINSSEGIKPDAKVDGGFKSGNSAFEPYQQ